MVLEEFFNFSFKSSKASAGKWKTWVSLEFVDNSIPDAVKIFARVMTWELEVIASSVTVWVFTIDSGLTMKWLVGVSNIVDKKSDSNRVRISISATTWPGSVNCLVIWTVLVIWLLLEPADESLDGICNV